jgi:hypothetical protein
MKTLIGVRHTTSIWNPCEDPLSRRIEGFDLTRDNVYLAFRKKKLDSIDRDVFV